MVDVVKYLLHHNGIAGPEIEKPLKPIPKSKDFMLTHVGVSEFDATLVRQRLNGDGAALLSLAQAADMLDIQCLRRLCLAQVFFVLFLCW
jgi:hypothetical protein